jgi:hypothetical protein
MWSVIVHKQGSQEFVVESTKFFTRANAQLFAEEYVLGYLAEHDGKNCDTKIVGRPDIERYIKDVEVINLDRHFILHNPMPWGLTVNHTQINRLESKTTEEVESIELREVEETVKEVDQVVIPLWFGRKDVRTVEKDVVKKVQKEFPIKRTEVKITHRRVVKSQDVFSITLAFDAGYRDCITGPEESERTERMLKTNDHKAACKILSDRLLKTNVFSDLADGAKLSELKNTRANEFDTYNAFKSVLQVVQSLDRMMQKVDADIPRIQKFQSIWESDSVHATWDHDTWRFTESTPELTEVIVDPTFDFGPAFMPPHPNPPRHVPKAGSALQHLNAEIMEQHRKMFSKAAPVIGSHRGTSKTLDSETIDNICNEIEKAVLASNFDKSNSDESNSDKSNSDESSSDSDSESNSGSESDSEYNSDSDPELESDSESEAQGFDSNGCIFEPREIN